MTGRIVECPIDEMNRPRGRQQAKLRIPPTAAQVDRLVAGWREELATCRKFAPAARNYAASGAKGRLAGWRRQASRWTCWPCSTRQFELTRTRCTRGCARPLR